MESPKPRVLIAGEGELHLGVLCQALRERSIETVLLQGPLADALRSQRPTLLLLVGSAAKDDGARALAMARRFGATPAVVMTNPEPLDRRLAPFQHGAAGILVRRADPREMAGELEHLIEENARRATISLERKPDAGPVRTPPAGPALRDARMRHESLAQDWNEEVVTQRQSADEVARWRRIAASVDPNSIPKAPHPSVLANTHVTVQRHIDEVAREQERAERGIDSSRRGHLGPPDMEEHNGPRDLADAPRPPISSLGELPTVRIDLDPVEVFARSDDPTLRAGRSTLQVTMSPVDGVNPHDVAPPDESAARPKMSERRAAESLQPARWVPPSGARVEPSESQRSGQSSQHPGPSQSFDAKPPARKSFAPPSGTPNAPAPLASTSKATASRTSDSGLAQSMARIPRQRISSRPPGSIPAMPAATLASRHLAVSGAQSAPRPLPSQPPPSTSIPTPASPNPAFDPVAIPAFVPNPIAVGAAPVGAGTSRAEPASDPSLNPHPTKAHRGVMWRALIALGVVAVSVLAIGISWIVADHASIEPSAAPPRPVPPLAQPMEAERELADDELDQAEASAPAALVAPPEASGEIEEIEHIEHSEIEAGETVSERDASDRVWREAEGLFAEGQVDAARALFRQALDIDPNNPHAMVALAKFSIETGEAREAIRWAREAVRRRRRRAEYYVVLGDAYRAYANRERARIAWTHALELEPGNEEIEARIAALPPEPAAPELVNDPSNEPDLLGASEDVAE